MAVCFVAKIPSYGSAFGIEITPKGVVLEDAALIENLRKHGDYGRFYFEAQVNAGVPTASERAGLKPPIVVEPVAAGSVEDDLKDLEEQEEIRATQQAEEDLIKAQRAEKEAHIQEVRAARGGGKRGRPKKEKTEDK